MFLKSMSQRLLLRHLCLNPHATRPMSFKRSSIMEKRAKMLDKLIENRDKKKHWHMVFASDELLKKKNVFEKVYKPVRRMNVLNSLFMKNITDVLSTSDVAPEVTGYGMEIVDIKTTADYRIVNVYWQLPSSKQSEFAKLETMLAQAAPRIRSELISRNVLGKVPKIFFIRDTTNLCRLQFEQNWKMINSVPTSDADQAPLIPIEELEERLFKFRVSRKTNENHVKEKTEEKEKPEVPSHILEPPADMKLNIFGLDYQKIMHKVVTSKKQASCSSETVVDHCSSNEKQHPFAAINAVPLRETKTSRYDIMKFCKLRNLQRAEIRKHSKSPSLDEYEPCEDLEYGNEPFCEEEINDFSEK